MKVAKCASTPRNNRGTTGDKCLVQEQKETVMGKPMCLKQSAQNYQMQRRFLVHVSSLSLINLINNKLIINQLIWACNGGSRSRTCGEFFNISSARDRLHYFKLFVFVELQWTC